MYGKQSAEAKRKENASPFQYGYHSRNRRQFCHPSATVKMPIVTELNVIGSDHQLGLELNQANILS